MGLDLEVIRSYWMMVDELREQDEITEHQKEERCKSMTVVGKTLNEYADEVIELNRNNRIRAVIQEELLTELGEFKDDIVD